WLLAARTSAIAESSCRLANHSRPGRRPRRIRRPISSCTTTRMKRPREPPGGAAGPPDGPHSPFPGRVGLPATGHVDGARPGLRARGPDGFGSGRDRRSDDGIERGHALPVADRRVEILLDAVVVIELGLEEVEQARLPPCHRWKAASRTRLASGTTW